MGTRVYPCFDSASQEAAFLGIDDYDLIERKLEIYNAASWAARDDEDQGYGLWEDMQRDTDVAELHEFRLWGFGRVNSGVIPYAADPYCDGVDIDDPAVPWILFTAGNYNGVESYGFRDASEALERLKACGCHHICWM